MPKKNAVTPETDLPPGGPAFDLEAAEPPPSSGKMINDQPPPPGEARLIETKITDDKGKEILPVPVAPAVELPEKPTESPLTLEMYLSVRKIPVQNRAGMRRYKDAGHPKKMATLPEWDSFFKDY